MKIFGIFLGCIGCLLIAALGIFSHVNRDEKKLPPPHSDIRTGPFAGIFPPDSKPYKPPPNFQLDLHDITVTNATSNSDEKQVLTRLEQELRSGADAPVFEIRWNRALAGQFAEPRTLIYERSALRLEYRIGNQSVFQSSGVKLMDIYGISHAATTDIARDIEILKNRK